MKRWLEMPLLGKELVELAAQPRTYVIRMACAVALYAFFLWTFLGNGLGETPGITTLDSYIGIGQRMFQFLAAAQLIGIFIFLPITVATSITREKERGTLDLLMLTDMNRWTLVLQKFLGGMIPLWSLLLLTAPLMAVAYAMGGVDTNEFISVEVAIVMFSLQLGALATAVSAYSFTTVGALVRYYVLAFCYVALCSGCIGFNFIQSGPLGSGGSYVWVVFGWVVINLLLTFVMLAVAVRYLVKRAHPVSRTSWLSGVSKIQRFGREFSLVTRTLAGRGARATNSDRQPERQEMLVGGRGTSLRAVHLESKRSLWTYLWWEMQVPPVVGFGIIGLATMGIVTGFMAWFGEDNAGLHSMVLIGLLSISSLWTIVIGSQLIPNERLNGTLDVLLTTPMSGREIIAYKMRELWRVLVMLAGFMGIICLMEAWVEHDFDHLSVLGELAVYLAGTMGVVVLTLMTVAWFAVGTGLRFQSRIKPLMLTLMVVAAWFIVPAWYVTHLLRLFSLGGGLGSTEPDNTNIIWSIMSLGPLVNVGILEYSPPTLKSGWPFVVMELVVNGTILCGVRWLVLRNADRWLGRVSAPGTSAGEANA